ncbi:GNAT family N-acetyltransferase [uncultured Nostoc sp.]|uniref:GNAT family N-acetyltransferase n=1 Tax=uncultured Nostoc sp. TaxID=340711 RepID=UPI0035CBD1FB
MFEIVKNYPNTGLSKPIITVRLITGDELPQLLALYNHLNPVDAPLPTDDVLQSIWNGILRDPRLYYIVPDVDNQLVAICSLTIVSNLTRGASPYGIIENVVTYPDYRQQGLGTQALHYVLALAW